MIRRSRLAKAFTAAWEHQASRHFEEDVRERQHGSCSGQALDTKPGAHSSHRAGLASPPSQGPASHPRTQQRHRQAICTWAASAPCSLPLPRPRSPAQPSTLLSSPLPPGCSRHLLAGLHLTDKNVPWSHAPFGLLSTFPVPLHN